MNWFRTTVTFTICQKDKPFGEIEMPLSLLQASDRKDCKVLMSEQVTEEVDGIDGGLFL